MTEWRKSSHSDGDDPSSCVEVVALPEAIAVRDSRDPDGPQLHLAPLGWRALIDRIRAESR